MRKGQKRMERCVDGGRAGVQIVGAMRKVADHLVVIVGAGIMLFQFKQSGLVERSEPLDLHGADVATGSFYPQDVNSLTR